VGVRRRKRSGKRGYEGEYGENIIYTCMCMEK
jgi:hypothetical protein